MYMKACAIFQGKAKSLNEDPLLTEGTKRTAVTVFCSNVMAIAKRRRDHLEVAGSSVKTHKGYQIGQEGKGGPICQTQPLLRNAQHLCPLTALTTVYLIGTSLI
jgi:ribosome modulation factor